MRKTESSPSFGVLVVRVGVGIAEEQIAAVADPDRPFGELESSASLKIFGFGPTISIDRGILPDDLDVHLARRDRDRRRACPV